MTLRRRFALYLVIVHLAAAMLAVAWLHAKGAWLLLAEALLLSSAAAGFVLLRRLFGAFAFTREASQLLADGDFMSRFRPVGQPELDRLIELYNRMSDRLRSERVRLEEQQQFLTRIMAVSPLGIVLLSFDGEIAYVNPGGERLLQQPASLLLGKPLGEIPGALADTLVHLADGDSTVVPLWGGRRARCQRGAFIDRGFPRSFMVVEELTEELRQFERAAYGKLIRMMSHEVNNSVGATRSLLQSSIGLGEQLPAAQRADQAEALGIAAARLDRLNAFMRSFADVVRMPMPVKRPCRVVSLLEGCVRLVQAQSDPALVQWTWDVQIDPGEVALDEAQMEQAIINILKNAAEALPASGGRIVVRAGRDERGVFIEVEDSGPGIADEARAHLFSPFFTTKQNGQGIGLTMVQDVLRRHDFVFSLDGPAGGPTRFRIQLH